MPRWSRCHRASELALRDVPTRSGGDRFMRERAVARIKRTRAAQTFKRLVLRRRATAMPRLSVVVPFYDSVDRLGACVDSLLTQTYPNLEVVLVDDGSEDGSAALAQHLAAEHPQIGVVRQAHAGVGAARNAGAAAARGEFLAFCDSDDLVVTQGYERLMGALMLSGSDVAVGSVTLQSQGRHAQPAWARRSNRQRALGKQLVEVPEVMGNLLPGTRVFRRAFWNGERLSFPT